jgi:hypothetical protein
VCISTLQESRRRENMGRVITYKNEEKRGMYCQIKLASGERIFISIAGGGIKISKMGFGGLIPMKTIWESKNVLGMMEQFVDKSDELKHPLDAAKDKLINCTSIEEVQRILNI